MVLPISTLWTAAERAWAFECFRSGDSIAEIAEAADRNFLDVALAIGVYGFVPLERRWQASIAPGGSIQRRWIGGMLREVAIYRCRRGEHPVALSGIAQISRSKMFEVLKGIVKRGRPLSRSEEMRAA